MKTSPTKIEAATNSDMQAMVFGDTAFVRGIYSEKSTTGGKDSSMKWRYTEDSWLTAHTRAHCSARLGQYLGPVPGPRPPCRRSRLSRAVRCGPRRRRTRFSRSGLAGVVPPLRHGRKEYLRQGAKAANDVEDGECRSQHPFRCPALEAPQAL